MDIEGLLDKIIQNSLDKKNNSNWNKDELMRYVYITLGKEISKSPNFFLTIEEKLESLGLRSDEINKIHHNDKSYEVTCLVTAKMLTYIYKNIGIEAEIIPTSEVYKHISVDEKIVDIQHYFIVATGEQDKKYFLTLNNDLPNIQLGLRTQFFATKLDYYNKKGIQVYEGDEIKYSVMSVDKIKEIDKKIGYLTHISDKDNEKYDYVSMASFTNNDTYIQNLIDLDESKFYEQYMKLFEKFGKEDFSTLTDEEVFVVKKYICDKVLDLIYTILKSRNFYTTEKEANELNNFLDNNDFSSFINHLRKIISKFNIDAKSEKEMFENPYAIINYTNLLINAIDKFKTVSSENEMKQNANNYRNSLRNLSKFFIPKERLRKNIKNNQEPEYFSNEYLANKFVIMFSKLFEPDTATIFSKMGFLEQDDILKRYYYRIFEDEFKNEQQLWKRVLFSIIRSKTDSDDYRVLIGFYNEEYYDEPYYIVYSPKLNKLEINIDILEAQMKYHILSKQIREKLTRM